MTRSTANRINWVVANVSRAFCAVILRGFLIVVPRDQLAQQIVLVDANHRIPARLAGPLLRRMCLQGETQIRREPMWMKTRKSRSINPVTLHFRLRAKSLAERVGMTLDKLRPTVGIVVRLWGQPRLFQGVARRLPCNAESLPIQHPLH